MRLHLSMNAKRVLLAATPLLILREFVYRVLKGNSRQKLLLKSANRVQKEHLRIEQGQATCRSAKCAQEEAFSTDHCVRNVALAPSRSSILANVGLALPVRTQQHSKMHHNSLVRAVSPCHTAVQGDLHLARLAQ